MALADEVEKLRDHPTGLTEAFRQQLERVRSSIDRMDGQRPEVRGMDRSNELTPIARPTIVRTLAGTN